MALVVHSNAEQRKQTKSRSRIQSSRIQMPPINDNRKLSLLMMEAEEMRDQDSLKQVLQKNQRMFKYLFGRYSGSNAISQSANVNGYSQAPATNQLYDKTIITAEVAKMLRDLGISQQAISKNDIQQLVKLINKK